MKILYAINSGKVGGAELHILELVKGLSAENQITVVCPAGEMVGKYKDAGARVLEDFPRFELDPLFMLRMMLLLRRENFDVVHTHELMMEGNLMIPAFLLRVPVRVIHVHSPLTGWQTPPLKKALNLVANFLVANILATKVVALMNSIKKERVRGEGILPGKIVVIPNGIDVKKFSRVDTWQDYKLDLQRRLGLSASTKIIGTVSRLTPEKGLSVLIEALEIWREVNVEAFNQCHVLVAGEGQLRDRLKDQVREGGLTEKVTFLGFISENEKANYLQSLDLFVFPTLHEGFGYVLAEAMVASTPTLSSDLPVLLELTDNGRYGAHFPCGDAAALAETLPRQLLLPRNEDILLLARNHIRDNYSLERFIERYTGLYESCLK